MKETKNPNDQYSKDDPMINLSALLIQTSDTITQAIELELAQYNINFPQARILFALKQENRPVTIPEISEWVLRELNSVSTLINKMEKAGLVEKTSRPGDRKTYITLTEKGDELYNHITVKAHHLTFTVLAEDERKEFKASLKKLRDRARHLLGIDFKPPFLP